MSKLIVIDGRTWGYGTGRYQERLVHYLQQIDTDHEYKILLSPKDFSSWQPTNPRFQKVLCRYKDFTFGEQIGMLKQIKNMRADLVHFPMVHQPVLYRGKTVTTIQDLTTARFRNPTKNWLVFTIKQQIYKLVNLYVAKKADWLITPSEFVRQDIAKFAHITDKKITVTYEDATALPRPATPLPYLEHKKFIMYLGRPLPHKNLWRLIQAFQLLQPKYPDLLLVLGGKKDEAYRQIEDRIKQEGIKNVVFTDFITDHELRWLYEHCQAYVFPSLSEGFGLPALEAMKHGAPLVSTNATCSPEVYGEGAHYFDPLNIEDMAQKISEVLDDENLRAALIERGQKQAAKYSWERMARQTLEVYKRILGE
jgi:glycosyltransferase involved in cell wall biosynthesis